jgi:hypothetical protein
MKNEPLEKLLTLVKIRIKKAGKVAMYPKHLKGD